MGRKSMPGLKFGQQKGGRAFAPPPSVFDSIRRLLRGLVAGLDRRVRAAGGRIDFLDLAGGLRIVDGGLVAGVLGGASVLGVLGHIVSLSMDDRRSGRIGSGYAGRETDAGFTKIEVYHRAVPVRIKLEAGLCAAGQQDADENQWPHASSIDFCWSPISLK